MEYIYPENITSNKLSISQIKQWKEHGYLLIYGLLEDDILKNAIKQLNILYPHITHQQNIIDDIASKQDFGSNGKLEFPCIIDSINQITLSKNIINAAKQLLNEDVRILQSDAWGK